MSNACPGCKFCDYLLEEDGRPMSEFTWGVVATGKVRIAKDEDGTLIAHVQPDRCRLTYGGKAVYSWDCYCAAELFCRQVGGLENEHE